MGESILHNIQGGGIGTIIFGIFLFVLGLVENKEKGSQNY